MEKLGMSYDEKDKIIYGAKVCTVILPQDLSSEEQQKLHYERLTKAPIGSSVCFPDGTYRTYELWGSEVAVILDLPEGLNILELGTSYGGSTALLALKARLVVTVDMFDPSQTNDVNYKERWSQTSAQFVLDGLRQFSNIVPIVGDTKLVVPCLKDNFFDFAFIDAGHTYEDVKADMEATYPKLKSRSIVMFHDFYFSPEVMNVLSPKQQADARSYAGINKYVHEIADDENIQIVGLSGIVKKEHIHL